MLNNPIRNGEGDKHGGVMAAKVERAKKCFETASRKGRPAGLCGQHAAMQTYAFHEAACTQFITLCNIVSFSLHVDVLTLFGKIPQ